MGYQSTPNLPPAKEPEKDLRVLAPLAFHLAEKTTEFVFPGWFIYIYIYMYVCMYVCMYTYIYI